MKKVFEITNDHLKLIKRFCVGWQDCETGAPEIDPKRPYGNSSVANDIHEILTGESIGLVDSEREELSDEEEEKYMKLHRETETALQIILNLGEFRTGKFEYNSFSSSYPYWKVIDEH